MADHDPVSQAQRWTFSWTKSSSLEGSTSTASLILRRRSTCTPGFPRDFAVLVSIAPLSAILPDFETGLLTMRNHRLDLYLEVNRNFKSPTKLQSQPFS